MVINHHEKIKLSRKRNTGSSNPVLGMSTSRLKIEGLKGLERRMSESWKKGGSLLRGIVLFGLELAQCDMIDCGSNRVKFVTIKHISWLIYCCLPRVDSAPASVS